MYVFIPFLAFLSVMLLVLGGIPFVVERSVKMAGDKQSARVTSKMDRMLMRPEEQRATQLYMFMPVILGMAGYLLSPSFNILAAVAGVILGLIFPSFYKKHLKAQARKKFDLQLTDALMNMSSSFRGGLSLVQAMETVAEDMPYPLANEFNTVLGENKMGVPLEDALGHLYNRMPSPSLQQTITAILLARETGGNLPAVFSRIVNSIRERRKLKQHMDALTLQGKIQGAVMSGLPIVFAIFVSSGRPDYFDVMMNTELGRAMLMACGIFWIVGVFLIIKMSKIKDV